MTFVNNFNSLTHRSGNKLFEKNVHQKRLAFLKPPYHVKL